MLLIFCFLYSASCILLLINHINVFCFILFVIIMLFIVIMLSVITRLHHFNYDIIHTYILLLVFCFLYSASYVLLLKFCFLCFTSCVLLFMFCFLYFASCVLLLMFCFSYFASCILLLAFCFLCSTSCILLLVFCFLYSSACRSYSRCSHTDMCILLHVVRTHCVVHSHDVSSLISCCRSYSMCHSILEQCFYTV